MALALESTQTPERQVDDAADEAAAQRGAECKEDDLGGLYVTRLLSGARVSYRRSCRRRASSARLVVQTQCPQRHQVSRTRVAKRLHRLSGQYVERVSAGYLPGVPAQGCDEAPQLRRPRLPLVTPLVTVVYGQISAGVEALGA
ncbi:ORFL130W [Human betaherpesvirus 5]|nr:ORFL130W [Human betaherpesvirus 5]QHX40453.1 ORFL130W [Human betaherpesvirus 5]